MSSPSRRTLRIVDQQFDGAARVRRGEDVAGAVIVQIGATASAPRDLIAALMDMPPPPPSATLLAIAAHAFAAP